MWFDSVVWESSRLTWLGIYAARTAQTWWHLGFYSSRNMSTEGLPCAMDLPLGNTGKPKNLAIDLKSLKSQEVPDGWTLCLNLSFAKIPWIFIIQCRSETSLLLLDSNIEKATSVVFSRIVCLSTWDLYNLTFCPTADLLFLCLSSFCQITYCIIRMKKQGNLSLSFNLRYQIAAATGCIHHDDVIPFAVLNIGGKGARWQE